MPRYYFDVRDEDGAFVDEVGLELPNMDAAVVEARRALGDMMRDALRDLDHSAVSIEIRDGAEGPIIVSVNLTTVTPTDASR